MNFSIDKNILFNSLQILSKAVPTRSTLPIISCALFSLNKNILNIRTTDLEIAVSLNINVIGKKDGNIAIPMSKLLEITNAMSNGEIVFSVSDIGKVNIKFNQGHYTIMGQPSEEFPSEQKILEGNNFVINTNDFKNIINNTTYATSKDDLKPVLQGVFFQINEEGLISVATDGHRLVKFENNEIKADAYKGTVVVPTKFLLLINNLLNEKEKTIIIISDNHIQTKIKESIITSRIIKDPYPDYEGVIPKDNTQTLIINKKEFSEAIKRVSIFSNKSSKQVSLNISEQSIIISTEDPENITSGKETLECSYDGEPMTIGYNASYLKEVLQHQQTEEIKIMLKSPLNAGLFIPLEQNKNQVKTTLLMPIRLND